MVPMQSLAQLLRLSESLPWNNPYNIHQFCQLVVDMADAS